MDQRRSSQVVEKFKQEKLNISILARIQQLLHRFEADNRVDRRLAWLGVILLIAVALVGIYSFGAGSNFTLSP